jgi:hypothetical protein
MVDTFCGMSFHMTKNLLPVLHLNNDTISMHWHILKKNTIDDYTFAYWPLRICSTSAAARLSSSSITAMFGLEDTAALQAFGSI